MGPEETIYLDSAATTPVDERVLAEMLPFLSHAYGNPSSVHSPGRQARYALEEARNRISDVLNCEPAEILFTGSGTEANNIALSAALSTMHGRRLITGATEHEAVLEPARELSNAGIDVAFIPPESDGTISATSIGEALGKKPAVVSIMAVNNVMGSVNDIQGLSKVVHQSGGLLHSDAIQAAPYYDLAAIKSHVDMMSLSAHKIRGPKGVGLLYSRGGVPIQPGTRGGKQERGRRAGTENVAGIVGFARALELARQRRQEDSQKVRKLRALLESEILKRVTVSARVITPHAAASSAPHVLSIVFTNAESMGLDGEMLVLGMDLAGVYVSTGSACSSGAVEPSHVYDALLIAPELARGAIRFSLSSDITENIVLVAAQRISEVVNRVGGIHP